jgi:hypothetical protein
MIFTMKRRRAQTTAAPETGLPTAYGRTCLALLDVDPFHVHAAWEIAPRDRAKAEQKYAETPTAFVWILRFHDECDGSTFDIPIDPAAQGWYVELWAAGKTYHAELGLRPAHGSFVSLCGSNTVTTPPAVPAAQQEPQWLAVTGTLEEARVVSAPVAEPEIRSQKAESRGVHIEPALAVTPEVAVQDFPLVAPPYTDVVTPVETVAELEPPAALAAVLEDKPVPSAGSSEAVGSFSMGGGAEKAALELEINAEVIVYGRAQPGQTLRVNGRPVPVNNDGTFHVRWALPVSKP